ncbi:hypothetical protein MSG28_001870 [Choristoneura fumiferana]|uniref:Uncharacterized protein n=1 Tax=Choristoneura fumiferana TaxID=7141 RepID=A0ACC0JT02_CHOFU|nr:hypothetical protein MSG28_001870 [Choristoneura fumiferana]
MARVPRERGRCVWASLARGRRGGGGAVCAGLPGLRVLRAVTAPPRAPLPSASDAYYLQAAACAEYFASPGGGWSGEVRVWGAAPGEGARLAHAAPALAVLLPPRRARAPSPAPRAPAAPLAPPRALVLTEDALHVWECLAPRPPPPPLPSAGSTRRAARPPPDTRPLTAMCHNSMDTLFRALSCNSQPTF